MRSIAFPVIGTGNFNFPRDAASKIMLEETISFCQANPASNVRDIRFVVFHGDQALTAAFKQEMDKLRAKHKIRPAYTMRELFSSRPSKFQKRVPVSTGCGRIEVVPVVTTSTGTVGKNRRFCVEVINGDLTQETTDAIMNINSTDMNMNNAGELSKAIANKSGPQVQQECSQLGKQSSGSAVMTSGGNLNVRHIIHIIPGSSDKQHLQQCLEEGLRVADAYNFRSISIPSVGTGGYGLSAADSAQVTFQALNNFSDSCKSVRKVRVVVFQAQMMQEFLQGQRRKPIQDLDEEESDSSSDETDADQPGMRVRSPIPLASLNHSVRIFVIGKRKAGVEKAVESLKKGFSEACTSNKVENEVISQLSYRQIVGLKRKAEDLDVQLEVEAHVDRISLRGQPTEVFAMVGEIWKEINERTKKKQAEEQAQLVSRNIEWSYEIHGGKIVFGRKANAKIEMACSKDEPRVQVSLRGQQFVIDLKTKTGRGTRTGDQITLTRKVKGAEEG